jgi:alkylation response protein AidB-like acyl-CoA dehydrogenase
MPNKYPLTVNDLSAARKLCVAAVKGFVMDFRFTEQQEMFRDSVLAFARKELADGALERAHSAQFPHEVAKKMAEAGLLGITIPEKDGGSGGTLMDAVIAIETIATVCPRSADVIQEGNFGAIRVLAHFANDDQKKRYLAPILKGDEVIAVAMTEPEAGSATTDLVTSATPDGDGYRINGRKVFPNPHADQYLVYVRYGPGVGGIGSVMLRRTAPGFSTGKPAKFMSGNDWATLYFDNVYVPPEDVLLGPGGFKKQIAGFNAERIGNASRSLAYGRYCYTLAREYAMTRKQFGRPLCEFQGLQWQFAELKMRLDAAQLLLYRAALSGGESGIPTQMDTAIAKHTCNQVGFDACNFAMQVMGGMGYSDESLIEYMFRKTRGWMIAGGSLEILKQRIAEGVFERSFDQRPPKAG